MPSRGPTWDLKANHGQPGYISNVQDMYSPNAAGAVAENATRVQAWEQEHNLSQFYQQTAGIDGDTLQPRDAGKVTQIEVHVGRTVK
jgi:anaerobic glycerol-3-phosphate dehydrogenase